MGRSHNEFVKYPRTPHLFGSKGTDDDKHLGEAESLRFVADGSLIVEEKIDGTNVGIHFASDGKMALQCRGHLITEGMHPQYDLFKQWAIVKRPVLEDRLGDRHILFGEWAYARHSVHYRRLPHYFFEFDVYDKESRAFLDLARRMTLLEGSGIQTVPVLYRGAIDREKLQALIRPSRFDSQFENLLTRRTDSLMEGLYLRTEADGVVTGRAKVVRPEFVEKIKQSADWQYQAMTPNQLDPDADLLVMNWDELARSSLDDILSWANDQPWARAMAACGQDAGWHSEGDVWTHTRMVCDQLPKLEGWSSLTSHERTVLIFSALFHDSGKPLTSQVDPISGRVTSPKHAVRGEHLCRSVLRDLGSDLASREEIARLVRFHGRPPFLLEKPDPAHEVVSLSWLVSNKLLYLFALADTRGRTTAEMGRPEEPLHLWRLVAEESDCFDRPYPFANDHARFLFYREARPNLHYVPFENYRCTVTMMSGLPGSGKDTWLAANRPDLPVISLDGVRSELDVEPTDDQGAVVQVGRKRCREFLRSGDSFAFNATNLLRQTRQRWIDLFADYQARIEIVYLEPPLSIILAQNKQRERPVPEKVIHELVARCEPPTSTEAHGLLHESMGSPERRADT